MAFLACYGLRGFANYAVPVMGKSQFSVLGYPPSPSFFRYQSLGPVWLELPNACHAVPGWVLTCCSFTKSCHFVAVAHPLAQEFTFPPEFAANVFRDPELRQLAQALPSILVHDRAASTVSTYLGKHGRCGTMLPPYLQTPLHLPSMWCLLLRRRDLCLQLTQQFTG